MKKRARSPLLEQEQAEQQIAPSEGVVMVGDIILCLPATAISTAPIMPEGFITDTSLMPPALNR